MLFCLVEFVGIELRLFQQDPLTLVKMRKSPVPVKSTFAWTMLRQTMRPWASASYLFHVPILCQSESQFESISMSILFEANNSLKLSYSNSIVLGVGHACPSKPWKAVASLTVARIETNCLQRRKACHSLRTVHKEPNAFTGHSPP